LAVRLCRNNNKYRLKTGNSRRIKFILIICLAVYFIPTDLYATQTEILYNISSQPLSSALRDFAKKSDISLIFSDPRLSEARSTRLSGYYTVQKALDILLSGTAYGYKISDRNIFYIVKKIPAPTPGNRSGNVDENDQPSGARFEEIIVTALKRSTSLQKTPISISILSGENLSRLGAFDIMDYSGFVNGLTIVDAGPGQRRLVIRGIQGIGEAQVGLYYGEVPVTGTPGSNSSSGQRQPEILLFDTDRIEVLRGPQGTLYGAGSMGGTVRILFKEPNLSHVEQTVEGRFSNTRHGGNNIQFNAGVNLPVMKDKMAFRAVGYYHTEDGYVDNVRLNLQNVNDVTTWGNRLQLKLQPSENLSLLFTSILQRLTLDNLSHWYPGDGLYQSQDYARTSFKDNTDIFNLKFDWRFSDYAMQLSTSYYQRDIIEKWDTSLLFVNLDRGLACRNLADVQACNADQISQTDTMIKGLLPLVVWQPQKLETWTNEVRWRNRNTGPLLWTIGAFFEERDASLTSQIFHAEDLPDKTELSGIQLHRYSTENLKQIAFFGEATYKFNEKLSLTFGSRYFNYSKRTDGETLIGIPMLNVVPREKETAPSEEGQWIYKIHGAYNLNEDILIYGQATDQARPVIFLRPNFQGYLAINYRPYNWLMAQGEINHTGGVLDEDSNGNPVRLPTSTEVNLRAFIRVVHNPSYGSWQVFGAIDNLTNTTILPQLGLPLAGRNIRLGLRSSF